MGSILLFFWFSQVKPKKQKKQNVRTYVPVSGMGSVLLFFFWFSQVKPKKQKKQNGRTYVPVSGMGSVLLVFLVFPGKTKKNKKPKWQNLCPSAWHGVSTFLLFFSVFLVFVEVFAIFWYLTWVLPFCFFVFQGFCNIRPFLKRLSSLNRTLSS